jgi:hypothetical protein
MVGRCVEDGGCESGSECVSVELDSDGELHTQFWWPAVTRLERLHEQIAER